MSRVYFHGDIMPAPDWARRDGIEAEWFWDARIGEVTVVAPPTTRPGSADLRRLGYQLRCKRYFLGPNGFRPDDAENVFVRSHKALPASSSPAIKPSYADSKQADADLRTRSVEHNKIVLMLRCENCDYGDLGHVGEKCMFEATNWKNTGRPRLDGPRADCSSARAT